MKEIPLPRLNQDPMFALVDDDMYMEVIRYRWHVMIRNDILSYATRRSSDGKTIYMHRWIVEHHLGRKLVSGEEIDHIDNNGLNNQLSNLRITNRSQNMSNIRRHRDSASDFIGVIFDKRYANPYRMRIMLDGRTIWATKGFDAPEKAAYERDLLAIKYFGNYTKLNFEENRAEYIAKLNAGYDPNPDDRQYSSTHTGIAYSKSLNKWRADIHIGRKHIYVGAYRTEEEAYQARKTELERLDRKDTGRVRKKKD